MKSLNALETVLTYHERTKHHLDRYAEGPSQINWNAQPDSFRHYFGTQSFQLPLVADSLKSHYVDLYQANAITTLPISLKNIATLLELSLGISAWKQYGDNRWALRCNPSSGNLHPTEGYVVLSQQDNLPAGIYHYLSYNHVLEQRGILTSKGATSLETTLSTDSFLLGLTSIPWREAWKYGERAFRYCQHDIGHAIAAIRYAAASLGWSVQLLDHWADEAIALTLGLNQTQDFQPAEPEVAEVMLWIKAEIDSKTMMENGKFNLKRLPSNLIISALTDIQWKGTANVLDPNHEYEWPIIDTIIEATNKPNTIEPDWIAPTRAPLSLLACPHRATDIIRQRRSAQHFDGATPLPIEAFYRLLDTTLPRRNVIPWDVFPHQPRFNLILFVHRVEGLSPGLYILVRQQGVEQKLQVALQREQFEWLKPTSCPKHLPFYRLMSSDAQTAAQQLSCHQEIAADSAFSLSMLAEFEDSLTEAWYYRQLFWEAGIIGQIFYLEAEAIGVRGTGIGCYFDDAVHSLLGLTDKRYQSLYHFTVGTPLHDKRLQTLPPYAHLNEAQI
jgi:SagB-type dehydrogenase family enzyme